MLTYGPAHPKRPPHTECTDRPNKGSITQWDHRNWPGVCGRDDRGRPSGPFLCSFHYYVFLHRLVTHTLQYKAATDLIEIRNALTVPKPRSSGHELGTVPMSQNERSVCISVSPVSGPPLSYPVPMT